MEAPEVFVLQHCAGGQLVALMGRRGWEFGHFTEPRWWRESDWVCTWWLYWLKTIVG